MSDADLDPATAATPVTGGQYCVSGLVLQLLVGLDRGLQVAVAATQQDGSGMTAATMVLEPACGGDHDIATPAERVVEQVKLRTTGKAWTPGEIAGEVLPDLARAVRDADDVPTRYRLATNGALNCGALLELAQQLRTQPVPADPLAALDDANRRAYFYGRWLSERGFFEALLARARIGEPGTFWRLVAGFEAEGCCDASDFAARIDAVLARVVDAQEDVVGKRHELIGRMAVLARTGGSIRAAALLEAAGLPAERLLHAARLPEIMRARLKHDLVDLGYEAAHDVRDAPRDPGGDLLLFSGESGFGKSWRLAALLAGAAGEGRLAMAVTQAPTLGAIRAAIVERTWLSGFDRALDLPALQRRLGPLFADEQGIWLTIGIDDIQDRELLAGLHAADWRQYGIRVAATVPVQLADELARRPRPPAEQRVGPFSRAQLRRFLESHGRSVHDLPDDVAELLCTPIFADLYRRGFAPGWMPTNEYELVDGFWRHATFEAPGMADAQDDVVALERAARTLLTPAGRYPWEVEDALATGLNAAARARLVRAGILRQSEAGVSLMHDRVLNWLVARALVADLRRERRTIDEAAALLAGFDTPGVIAPGLAYRLGYVMLDLLWLGAGALAPHTVHALVERMLESPQNRINEGPFIEEHLAGLGPAILPVLAIMASRAGEDHDVRRVHAARAIAEIGRRDPAAARPVIGALLDADGEPFEMGLIAAARVAVPAARDRLWTLHCARRAEASSAPDDLDARVRHDLFDRAQTSLKALKRAVGEDPGWIEARLAESEDGPATEILLELVFALEHGQACALWQRQRRVFLRHITGGRAILARAIGRFGDGENADRLEDASADAERLEPSRRFDALLRVAPERAAEAIDTLDRETLRHGWFSLRRLVREGGLEAQARLLARHQGGWESKRDLALLYWHAIDLIDAPAFDAIIAALEDRLGELAGTHWTPRGEGHLIHFLARTRRPDLLARLRARKGSRFEELVRDLAMSRNARSSLSVDREGDQLERLLMHIGGEGYGALVGHSVGSATPFAREDGFGAALRLPQGSPHAGGLGAAVASADRHRRESYDLMVALAAHRHDGPLYDLVAATGSAFTDALDIRASLGPMAPAVAARIRADLASADSSIRIGATCALALAPPDDVGELLAETLVRFPVDDPSALTVVRIAHHLEAYTPRMLPSLEAMLALPDDAALGAVLPYLAAAGDAAARAVAAGHLEQQAPPKIDQCALKTAFSLSAHEHGSGPGLERLKLFLDRHHGIYPVGLIAARLHERGAITDEVIVELAYTARRLSAESSAYLIERVAEFDPDEARAIAEHHFARVPSGSAARQVLRLAGEAGIDALLGAHGEEGRQLARWMIARALRRHADRDALLERLEWRARSNTAEARIEAAELLGWLPGERSAAMLERLARDPVPETSDAALLALERHTREAHARALIAELPEADELGRWSRLAAIVDLVDPYLLESDTDGLALGPAIDTLGEALAIGAECAVKTRKEELEKEARQRDREEPD